MTTENGYEYENQESIDKNLICPVCDEPFIVPVSTPCGHSFCRECVEKWLGSYCSTCPTCRKPTTKSSLKPITLFSFLSILDQLPTKCKLCGQSKIQRGNFQEHLKSGCQKAKDSYSSNNVHYSQEETREKCNYATEKIDSELSEFECIEMNHENQDKTAKPAEENVTYRSVFQIQHMNDNMIIMCMCHELEHFPNEEFTTEFQRILLDEQCTHVNFFGHQLLSENVSLIASAIVDKTFLKCLELGKCSIHDSGVQILATQLISTPNTLQCIDLYGNSITDVGVQYLAEMLKTNKNLKKLKLGYNGISNEGMQILAHTLIVHNTNLRLLSLAGNKAIDNESIDSICNIIRLSQGLRTLNLEDCNIPPAGEVIIRLCQIAHFRMGLTIMI